MIKNCPLCDTEIFGTCCETDMEKRHYIWCYKCRASSGFYPTKEQAIAAWNKRPAEEVLTACENQSKSKEIG